MTKVVGGLCDGQNISTETRWDGRGYRPLPVVRLMPPMSLPDVVPSDVSEMDETFVPLMYYLHVFDRVDRWGHERWYEYHTEPQRM